MTRNIVSLEWSELSNKVMSQVPPPVPPLAAPAPAAAHWYHVCRRFGLNGIEVEAALPRIDTSYTAIWDYCPRFLRRPQSCRPQRYRRHDGICNNLENPTWGAARTPFRRLVPPEYGDGEFTSYQE